MAVPVSAAAVAAARSLATTARNSSIREATIFSLQVFIAGFALGASV
jgi:hypothetical protein